MNARLQAAADGLADKIVGAIAQVNNKIVDLAINQLLDDDGGDTAVVHDSADVSEAANEAVQDTVDCLRRFVRYSRTNNTASKEERNIARRAIKAAKDYFDITSGPDDVFSE